MADAPSLQDRYAPHNACFGCGPANPKGLRIKSHATGDGVDAEVVAEWQGETHHEAFEGMLNGGIIGTLLDCHSNWTAARALMVRDGLEGPPCTVTAEFHVRMRRPTPSDREARIVARAVELSGNRATVEASLSVAGEVTATCTGTFVAVEPGHPAYHRW